MRNVALSDDGQWPDQAGRNFDVEPSFLFTIDISSRYFSYYYYYNYYRRAAAANKRHWDQLDMMERNPEILKKGLRSWYEFQNGSVWVFSSKTFKDILRSMRFPARPKDLYHIVSKTTV